MLHQVVHVARVMIVVLVACVASAPPAEAIAPVADPALAAIPGEVRIRKLHLVRPDLILYPIAMEVYC